MNTPTRHFLCTSCQVDLLKSRGLLFRSEDQNEQFLLYKNYYNVINRYGQYFFDSDRQLFYPNTYFNDILNLYFFDNDLKHTFYRKLMKVETHFKSVMAHIFCKYHSEEFSFLNPNNFNPVEKDKHISLVGKLTSQIKYNNSRTSPDNPIKHHMKKYGHVPFWVLVNYLYMSDTINFYDSMNKSERNEVAEIFYTKYLSEYDIKALDSDKITPDQITSFLKMLNDYRNLIAHDNFLFGAKIKTLPKYCSCVYRDFNISNNDLERNLYMTLIIMRVFLERNSYNNLNNKIRKLFNKLKQESNQEHVNEILEVMGFPHDWNLLPKQKDR